MSPAVGCSHFEAANPPDERVGILYYGLKTAAMPSTTRGPFPLECRDEPYERLKPYHPWQVPDPQLVPGTFGNTSDVGRGKWRLPGSRNASSVVNFWTMGFSPMFLNYSNPIVKNLDKTNWDDTWVVYPAEDFTNKDWVYLVITGVKTVPNIAINQTASAHPVSLNPASERVFDK